MSDYKIEFEKILSLTSKGKIFLGDTETTFTITAGNVLNEKELFENLRENGYGTKEHDIKDQEIARLKKALEIAEIGIETAIKLNDQGKIHTAEGVLLETQKQIKEIMESK